MEIKKCDSDGCSNDADISIHYKYNDSGPAGYECYNCWIADTIVSRIIRKSFNNFEEMIESRGKVKKWLDSFFKENNFVLVRKEKDDDKVKE